MEPFIINEEEKEKKIEFISSVNAMEPFIINEEEKKRKKKKKKKIKK